MMEATPQHRMQQQQRRPSKLLLITETFDDHQQMDALTNAFVVPKTATQTRVCVFFRLEMNVASICSGFYLSGVVYFSVILLLQFDFMTKGHYCAHSHRAHLNGIHKFYRAKMSNNKSTN